MTTPTSIFTDPTNFPDQGGNPPARGAQPVHGTLSILSVQPPKRALSNESSRGLTDTRTPATKRPRHVVQDAQDAPPERALGETSPHPAVSLHTQPHRLSSASVYSTAEAVAAMLNRPEDTGGTRTVKLARALAGSPARSSHSSMSRHSSEHSSTASAVRPDTNYSRAAQLLGQIDILEFLQQDERPTFVIDLSDGANFSSTGLQMLYANPALRARPALLDHVQGKSYDPTMMLAISSTFTEFKSWALSHVADSQAIGISLPPFTFVGVVWTCSTIRKRFRLYRAHITSPAQPVPTKNIKPEYQHFNLLGAISPGTSNSHKAEPEDYFEAKDKPDLDSQNSAGALDRVLSSVDDEYSSDAGRTSQIGDQRTNKPIYATSLAATSPRPLPFRQNSDRADAMQLSSLPEQGFFDWTRLPISSALPQHILFTRSVDWGATSLGPIENWSADLRGMCNLIMASPHPAAMYWGKDHVAIYNEAYIGLAGKKHPGLMGKRYQDAWKEIWHAVKDVFSNALSSAQATMKDDDCLFMERNGFLEETYFSWSVIPLIGDDGSVGGLYNPAFEKTRRKIAERRMLTLREVGEKTSAAREVAQFWGLLLEGLEYNEYDIPLVMIYSIAEESVDSDASSVTSSSFGLPKQCVLEGTLGIPAGHPAAPFRIDLRTGTEGFGAAFRKAMVTNRPIVLTEAEGTLDMEMLQDVEWRGFGDPSRTAVVCPIQPTTGESTLGFLVMGTNPRRPYDEDFDLFIQLIGRQLATSVAAVVLFEEEIRRGEKAAKMAAQDRIELSNQLAARTQEAVESEIKFTRMAELAPVGMFIADAQGKITYCNDTWYDISSYPKGEDVGDAWLERVVKDEDRPMLQRAWNTMLQHKVPISIEFRFKMPWRDKTGISGDTWVLTSAYPEKGREGQVKSIFGSVTDISSQKFAEDLQKRRVEEAVEMKRQQENFIDITSHEMRNPLSAILQCADEISTSLADLRNISSLPEAQAEIVDSNIDAAQTITLCAQHQKRIVDDVLTLSKLDSAMLLVTPVDVQPVSVVQRALKMFEGELQTNDIVLDFRVDNSFHALRIDWVRLDPSRLLQVLINLTTNAIKFTTTQERRTIIMHLAASTNGPSAEQKKRVSYIPTRAKDRDTAGSPEWGSGEVVFIHFAVQDTGRGLSEDEKKLLFQRFSQASPRTHITYGGSGLGLFISRELVELQGGEIGVSSESGKGSTFAFYVKARRSSAPQGAEEEHQHDFSSRKSSSKSIRIPILQPNGSEIGYGHTTPAPTISRAASASAAAQVPPSEALKVLLVEDNLVNQKVLAKQLTKLGCVVYLANHGGEALERLKETRFWKGREKTGVDLSIILMDLEMPVMDGTTCAKKIRELQLSGTIVRHIPVIAVTANAREEQIKTTLDAGIDDVVSKPFRIPELLPKIRDLMDKYGMRADPR